MSKRISGRQDKPRREEAKGRELSELKKENGQLKRQLTRLRKQILHLQEMVSFSTEEPTSVVTVQADDRPKCDRCVSTNVSQLVLPIGTLKICKDCGHRKTIPKAA
jgi:hypothetical protein